MNVTFPKDLKNPFRVKKHENCQQSNVKIFNNFVLQQKKTVDLTLLFIEIRWKQSKSFFLSSFKLFPCYQMCFFFGLIIQLNIRRKNCGLLNNHKIKNS